MAVLRQRFCQNQRGRNLPENRILNQMSKKKKKFLVTTVTYETLSIRRGHNAGGNKPEITLNDIDRIVGTASDSNRIVRTVTVKERAK